MNLFKRLICFMVFKKKSRLSSLFIQCILFDHPHHQDELNKIWIDFMDETCIHVCGQNDVKRSMVMNVQRFHELNPSHVHGSTKSLWAQTPFSYVLILLFPLVFLIWKFSSIILFLSKGDHNGSWKVMILCKLFF